MRVHFLIYFFLFSVLTAIAQKPVQHPEGKFVTVNGAKLWVEVGGKGDPLFLISGGPGGAHVGLHGFDDLQNSSTMVFIDNFGRGKSDTAKNVSEYSLSRD